MPDAVRVGSQTISVSNADRVMFPDDGITKGEVVDYYRRVAPWMVPHLKGRPVSMQRVRENIDTQVFYQKDMPSHFPDWIDRVTVPKVGGTVTHVVCDDAETLVYIANQGCITPHVWLSRVAALDKPDRMIIDLDPGDGGVADARFAAHLAREVLTDAGLVPYLMATGSRGYHVVVPLRPKEGFEDVREVCFGLAEALARRAPDRLTTEFYKAERAGRLFLDCNRNAWAQTAVPPFAVRPKAGAPVAVPLDWDELDVAEPDGWNVRTVTERLEGGADPWADFGRHMRTLTAARRWLKSENG
ncbi:MAG TPA: non-homologous end-joining DNA ligase [Candidatus Limnocylindrales bacterium]|nr:non-homologous end-joining DNA ligase [Candidatus Limnocylindrales bacterium]